MKRRVNESVGQAVGIFGLIVLVKGRRFNARDGETLRNDQRRGVFFINTQHRLRRGFYREDGSERLNVLVKMLRVQRYENRGPGTLGIVPN
jgi:hypothetical protein